MTDVATTKANSCISREKGVINVLLSASVTRTNDTGLKT